MTDAASVAAALDVVNERGPHDRVDTAQAHHDCANCGAHLQGAYCHACGQKAHLHTRLWHLLEEFIEGVAHFDGRFWRTLPLLAFRPGKLSRAWIEGKRVRYVPPLHLFLFAVFSFFTVMTFVKVHPFEDIFKGMALQQQTSEMVVGSGAARVVVPSDPDRGDWIDKQLAKVAKNPQYYGYKAESLSYKLALLVVPLSMLILAAVTLFKRGYSFYDHGVVALYGLGFAGLVTALLTVVGPLIPFDIEVFGLVALALHLVVHLRGAYRLSWVGAVARSFVVSLASMTFFAFFLLLVIGLSTA